MSGGKHMQIYVLLELVMQIITHHVDLQGQLREGLQRDPHLGESLHGDPRPTAGPAVDLSQEMHLGRLIRRCKLSQPARSLRRRQGPPAGRCSSGCRNQLPAPTFETPFMGGPILVAHGSEVPVGSVHGLVLCPASGVMQSKQEAKVFVGGLSWETSDEKLR